MPLSKGDKLGPYEVLAPLGAGGMGEVYRARDSKLHRDVAIKVLPDAFAADPDRLARFTREAQMLASLNHPNIASIYGVEERALVLELVDGPTLAERIAAGRVPVEEALPVARQIAEALEYAHDHGIVHRDLKPANIKVTPEGRVKVLDFGLAKAFSPEGGMADPMSSPTLTMRATTAGAIMGTAAYMAPEQARGQVADKRADIWAFGVVLLEMLTGVSSFAGETVSDTLASVLKSDPNFARLPADTPASVRRLLQRCLARDRRDRLHDIADARLEIDAAGEVETVAAAAAAPANAAKRSRVSWAAWVVAAVGIPLAYWLHTPAPPEAAAPVRFLIDLPDGQAIAGRAAISPDGRRLVVPCQSTKGERMLWLRDLDSLAWRRLAGTEEVTWAFWSPDSASIGFFTPGKLKRVAVSGGGPQTVTDGALQRGASWSQSGSIVLGGDGGIGRVDASGGTVTTLVKPGFSGAGRGVPRWPSLLPDGKRFVFDGRAGVFVGTVDGAQPPRKVLDTEGQVLYAAGVSGESGYLLFRRGESLMAAPFDARRAQVTGDAFSLADSVYGEVSTSGVAVSVSAAGRALVFYDSAAGGNANLVAMDRTGKVVQNLPSAQAPLGHLELSPDGTRLLGNRADSTGSSSDLWTMDIKRATLSRLTYNAGRDTPGVWSADGRQVYFAGEMAGKPGLFVTPSDGSGQPKLVAGGAFHHLHASADGKYLALEMAGVAGGAGELAVYNLERGGAPETVVKNAFAVGSPRFSPDGRWMGYTSAETGRNEVYVQSFPPGNGRWQVSTGGGFQMKWRRDGKEIYYKDLAGAIWGVPVAPKGAALEFGSPVKHFDTRMTTSSVAGYFAVSADGSRFFAYAANEEHGGRPLTVVLNWTAGLKK
jgi:Tol biopolymer transport system component